MLSKRTELDPERVALTPPTTKRATRNERATRGRSGAGRGAQRLFPPELAERGTYGGPRFRGKGQNKQDNRDVPHKEHKEDTSKRVVLIIDSSQPQTKDNGQESQQSDRTEEKKETGAVIPETQDMDSAMAESKQMYDQEQEAQKRLQERVRNLDLFFPAKSMVRQQGDCFADSLAFHIYNFTTPGPDDIQDWLKKHRHKSSLFIRTQVCDFMRDNPTMKPPGSELALAEICPRKTGAATATGFVHQV